MDKLMVKTVQVRMNTELYDFIEKYRIENELGDKPDFIREIIEKEKDREKSLFEKLKTFILQV